MLLPHRRRGESARLYEPSLSSTKQYVIDEDKILLDKCSGLLSTKEWIMVNAIKDKMVRTLGKMGIVSSTMCQKKGCDNECLISSSPLLGGWFVFPWSIHVLHILFLFYLEEHSSENAFLWPSLSFPVHMTSSFNEEAVWGGRGRAEEEILFHGTPSICAASLFLMQYCSPTPTHAASSFLP